MTTEINKTPELTTIVLKGRLDTPSTPDAEAAILPLLDDESIKEIKIDCTGLDYISSSGLRIFISVQKNFLKTGRKLTLCNLTPTVQNVFDMTGFSSIFNIE